MKTSKIRISVTALIAALFATAFTACNLYEHEEVETILCPRIDTDTLTIPDWEDEDITTQL